MVRHSHSFITVMDWMSGISIHLYARRWILALGYSEHTQTWKITVDRVDNLILTSYQHSSGAPTAPLQACDAIPYGGSHPSHSVLSGSKVLDHTDRTRSYRAWWLEKDFKPSISWSWEDARMLRGHGRWRFIWRIWVWPVRRLGDGHTEAEWIP